MRTLTRGAAMRLPTGQQVRDALGEADIASTPQWYPSDPWKTLRDVGLDEDTPLWYYILLEAQLDPGVAQGQPITTKVGGFGATLGKLGSRLVAELIEASLLNDPTSFVSRHGPTRPPDPWKVSDTKTIPVNSLKDLAKVVGV